MRYLSLNLRKYLILDNISLNKNFSFLEIGIGLGEMIDPLRGKIKEYYGVGIALELINYFDSVYKDRDSVNLSCLDVCQKSSSLNKNFDLVFSTDTLEHLKKPEVYFNFIKRHLKPEGTALVIFPNESKEKHHGITWFDSKGELLKVINQAGFKIDSFIEVKRTIWHRIIKKSLWELLSLIIAKPKENVQTFEQTRAFKVAKSPGLKPKLFVLYAAAIRKIARLFPLYRYCDNIENIANKILLIRLKHLC